MKFETWLRQQPTRDDRVGDLAQDYRDALKFLMRRPFQERILDVNNFNIEETMALMGSCYAAYDSLTEALTEWQEFELSQGRKVFHKRLIEDEI